MAATARKPDAVDKFIVFLAKRDGIDKVVKTFQYVCKLGAWRLRAEHPELADRFQKLEGSCGLSRKAFRTGRFLSGFNALRTSKEKQWAMALMSVLANSGEMIYFFFDHFSWAAKAGFIDPRLAKQTCFISAFGETVGYVFFIAMELVRLKEGMDEETHLLREVERLNGAAGSSQTVPSSNQATCKVPNVTESMGLLASGSGKGGECSESTGKELEKVMARLRVIRYQRLAGVLSIAAQVADSIIAMQDVKGGPRWTNPVVLGISGLVSAWSGWYRAYPA